MKLLIVLSILALVKANKSPHGEEYLSSLSPEELSLIPKEIAEDALLDAVGLITKYGYPVETHEVQTEDGYLITLHRIPGGRNYSFDEDRTPVLLMHGLFSSTADWIINGPGKAFGYILADEGFDVWFGNARGNYYSRKHVSLNPDSSSKYWAFSWHEIGTHDIPAMIDRILEVTGKDKLHYVGHSQGTTAFFVMGSTRKEYNNKILSMQAFGPAVYVKNMKSPFFKYLAPYAHSVKIILSLIGIDEFFPNTNFTTMMGHKVCGENSTYLPLCTNFLFQLFGYNPEQLNVTMLPVYLGHSPAGSSSRQLVHFAQIYLSDKFRLYDYGSFVNLAEYNSFTPPRYKLKYVTAPVALHYGNNDILCDPIDVQRLNDELPNSLGMFKVPDEKFNHIDFVYAIDAKTLLYDSVVSMMKSYDKYRSNRNNKGRLFHL